MSNAAVMEKARAVPDDGTGWIVLDEPQGQVENPQHDDLTDWFVEDPIDELLSELKRTGRGAEVEMIVRTLKAADHEKDAQQFFLHAMQEALAEDWDSEDDNIYDEM